MEISPKQIEIVQMIANGKTNPDIAKAMWNSTETIKTHIKNLLIKNDLKTRSQIVAVAMREGIIQ